jgi:preprotein translocase subunit SecD
MRRLIAYISLAVSLIVATALTILAPMKNFNSNLEYSNGREFVYRITPKEGDDSTATTDDLPIGAIDEVFDIMDNRMETFGVSEYQLAKEGNDVIRATASLASDQYDRLRVYLNYNANFTIRIAKDDETTAIATADQMFDGVKARIEYRGPYPFIIIPLSDPVWFRDNIVSVAEKIQEEEQTQKEDGSTPDLVDNAKIIIWSDFNPDTDSYDKSKTDNEIAAKLFLSFDYRQMFWDEDQTEIAVASPIDGYNEQNSYTTAQIKQATETARFMVNVFNAGSLPYKVDFLFENRNVLPSVEPLLKFGQKNSIALSRTLIAFSLAFLFIFVVIGLIYRLPIFGVISSFALTMLGTVLLFNAIAVEISTSALIGFVFVGLLAIFGNIIYLSKFRNEVYRGRSFKKAHAEANRRSSIYNLDALVVTLITGVVTYFTAGPAVIGFGTVLIFGAIVGLVSILLHNTILYWLLANNTSTQKNYKIYGVDSHKVANLLENEKPSYFGRFAEAKPKTKGKLYTGIFGAILVAGIVTLSVFASLGRNPLSLVVQNDNLTRVYLRVSENSSITPSSQTDSPEKILGSITFEGKALELVMNGDIASYEIHEYSTKTGEGENAITTKYTYLVYELVGEFSGEEVVSYNYSDLVSGEDVFYIALEDIVKTIDANAIVSINHVKKQAVSPSVNSVVIVSLITVAFTTVYMGIRFGVAKGLTNLLVTSASSLGVLLFFIATRITVHPLTALGALIAVLVVALINVVINNYQKDVMRDSFFRELTKEEKQALGLTMSLTPLYVIYILGAIAFIFFMAIAPYVISMVYTAALLAILISLLAVTKLNLTLNGFFNKVFAGIASSIKEKAPKSKRALHRQAVRRNAKPRGNEPEEAIIIGIND